jgi:hypothetical protein
LWYHIPSIWEWSKLFEYRCLWHVDHCSYKKIQYPDIDYNVIWYNDKNVGTYFASDLLIPLWWELLWDYIAREDDGFLWSSSVQNDESMFFTINSGDIDTSTHHGRVYWMNIRCFKNYWENEEIIEGSRREKLWNRLFG